MTRARTIAATRRGLSAFLGAALVVALTVLAAPPATSGTSATPWLPEVEASDGSGVVGQVVSAIGPDGSFVVAWAERAVGDQTSMRLLVATRGPGAAGFSAPVEAAPAGGRVSDVVVVADATGATTVAWVREGTTDDRVEAARRPPGRTSFGAPETIAVASDGMRDVEGVGDAAGRVTLAWLAVVSTDLGPVPQAQSATREPVFAEWSTPIVLTPTEGHAFGLRLTADGAGAVTAAWLLFVSGDFLVQSRTRPAGSAVFEAVQTHSAPDGWAPFMDLASNAPGAASLVWWQLEGSSYVLRAADRSPGAGSFGAPVVVATIAADQVHRGPLVALDGAGTVTIIWTRRQGQDQFGVWAATRPVGGSFTAPALVATSAGPIDGLSLSSSAGTKAGAGVTVLAWTETLHPGSNSRLVRAAYRPAGGEFGTAVDLTAPVAGRDDGAVAAVDAAGDAHVVWRRRSRDEAFPSHVYARVLDVTAPGLGDVGGAGDGHGRRDGRDVGHGDRPLVGSAVDHVGLRRRRQRHGRVDLARVRRRRVLRRAGDRDRRRRQHHQRDPDDRRRRAGSCRTPPRRCSPGPGCKPGNLPTGGAPG